MGAKSAPGAALAAGIITARSSMGVAAMSGSGLRHEPDPEPTNSSASNNSTALRFLRSMPNSGSTVIQDGRGQMETQTFMSTILQGHNASRELLLVGVSAFAASLLFAVLLYQKTQVNSASAHAYSAINLDDSAITDDTEFEEDFGNLIDDQYEDEGTCDRNDRARREEDWEGFELDDDDDDDDDDDVGFRGVFS